MQPARPESTRQAGAICPDCPGLRQRVVHGQKLGPSVRSREAAIPADVVASSRPPPFLGPLAVSCHLNGKWGGCASPRSNPGKGVQGKGEAGTLGHTALRCEKAPRTQAPSLGLAPFPSPLTPTPHPSWRGVAGSQDTELCACVPSRGRGMVLGDTESCARP